MHGRLTKEKLNSVYTYKITSGAENTCLLNEQAIKVVLCKFHFSFQMGNYSLWIAEDSGLGFTEKTFVRNVKGLPYQ